MSDLLVLWDIDGTLLNSGGVGHDLYDLVFLQLFGRSLKAFAPMAGRTDRAIILDTLSRAGVSEPRRYVDPFIAGLTAQAPMVREAVAVRGHALPGAAAVLRGLHGRAYQSVLTGNVRSVAEVKLAALGLRDRLDLCIGAYGDDHEVRAELVHVARRRAVAVHGSSPSGFAGTSTVVVGDTPLDIEAAPGRRGPGRGRGHRSVLGRGPGRRGSAYGTAGSDGHVPGGPGAPDGLTAERPAARALVVDPGDRAFACVVPGERVATWRASATRVARQAGEQGLSVPVQPRWRNASASSRAVSQALRVTSTQPYRSVARPAAMT